jgi:hypothetical protein
MNGEAGIFVLAKKIRVHESPGRDFLPSKELVVSRRESAEGESAETIAD